MKLRLSTWSATHVGLDRPGNEDRFYANSPEGVFCVCDGIGGHAGGEVAASTAIEVVQAACENPEFKESFSASSIREWVDTAASAIAKTARPQDKTNGGLHIPRTENHMGTTMVLLRVKDNRAQIAHAGDSRCYRLRAGMLERLTKDHTAVEVALAHGRPTRPSDDGMLLNALGVDAYEGCHLANLTVQPGDVYVLCSDGLHGPISDQGIRTILMTWRKNGWAPVGTNCANIAEAFVTAANATGGADNVTVVVVVVNGLYETLGVSKDASAEEIRTAWRDVALEHHPDKNPGDGGAEQRFKEANTAYQILSDDAKRASYDRDIYGNINDAVTVTWWPAKGAPGRFRPSPLGAPPIMRGAPLPPPPLGFADPTRAAQDDVFLCKATLKDGRRCTAPRQEGNYGFCGRHRAR
jgi:serine/threonine protein phosphatase PrpC